MKKVLVTGGSKGIGREIACVLADKNYEVYVIARNKTLLEDCIKNSKVKNYLSVDLLKNNACEEIFKTFSDIDILINNAGICEYFDIDKYENEVIFQSFLLNSIVPFKLASLYSKQMKEKKWGRIINIGSISAVIGEAEASLYSSSKAALIGMTRSLGLELAPFNITVNTIHPGWVKTDLGVDAINNSDFSEDEIIDCIPQKRFIQPNEIANLVAYLISDNAKGLTGQNINLCAGLSIG